MIIKQRKDCSVSEANGYYRTVKKKYTEGISYGNSKIFNLKENVYLNKIDKSKQTIFLESKVKMYVFIVELTDFIIERLAKEVSKNETSLAKNRIVSFEEKGINKVFYESVQIYPLEFQNIPGDEIIF